MDPVVQAFGLGVLSAASPCLLPLYSGLIPYLAANSPVLRGRAAAGLLGKVVLTGVLTTTIAFGLAVTALAISVGTLLGILVPVADLLLIALSGLLVARRHPFERLPGVRVPVAGNPYRQAFLYGALLGPLALPCAGPFVVALFAISLGVGDLAARVVRSIAYGLGFGLPLVALSLVAAARGQALIRAIVARYSLVERLAGLVLMVVGAWDLARNWENIRAAAGF
jgi:cytochrome c biogenesis protein CcdA